MQLQIWQIWIPLLLTLIILILSLYYRSKKKLILLIGPPSSGKTQFIQSLFNRKQSTVSSLEAAEYLYNKITIVDIPGHSQLQFLHSKYKPSLVILFVKDQKDVKEFECPVYYVGSQAVAKESGIECITLETATEKQCSIILANDPDADRLAIAEYQKATKEWHIFTGNQIGVLIASFILESLKTRDFKKAVLTTTVSSHMLQEMAKQHGILFDETLTGFKWLGNRAIDLKEQGYSTVFAYEEAIGFMCHDIVHDKDGISALAIFSEWANHLYSKGMTVREHLDSLYKTYGYWVSNNAYFSIIF